MADKPTIHSTWAEIDKQASELSPGPFVLTLPGNKRITFPDPLDMDWIEVEGFIRDIVSAPNSESFKRWLSEEDYQKLADAKPSLKHVIVIARSVQEHYGAIADLLGESSASRG
ncbi:MAG TPA: hypothetical protein VFL73_02800 [Solirubrobacteraceae bacterium]|nr:hypothetical protein [Solirubrobacteraceae bacterium]